MKKLVCALVALSLFMPCITVFSDTAVSEDMEKVLIEVKKKIDVPDELTDFSSGMNTHNGNEKIYEFYWNSDSGKSLSAGSDDKGRIKYYYHYTQDRIDAKISPYTKNDIIAKAEEFVKKIAPEAYSPEIGTLVFDESSYRISSNLHFSLNFVRKMNGITVKDNFVDVSGYITADGPIVDSFNSSIDYDTEFVPTADVLLTDYEEIYRKTFPSELVYYDHYNYQKLNNGDEIQPSLIYRLADFNSGYISAVDGEVVIEDAPEYGLFKNESAAMGTASDGALREELSESEIKELGTIDGLISVADAEKILKKLPYVKFNSSLKLQTSRLNKNSDGEYFYRLYYSNDDTNINTTINAHNGKILSLSNSAGWNYDEKELNDSAKQSADKKTYEFLNAVAPEEMQTVGEAETEYNGSLVTKNYARLVNGIKYVNNGIRVAINAKKNVITNYTLSFTDKEFAPPENIITAEDAYIAINKAVPIERIYIKSDGKYVLCYGMSNSMVCIDAFTGDVLDNDENTGFNYTDMSGHWAEEAVLKLSEVNIGFKGETFNPDSKITQEDLLRLFAAGIKYNHYLEMNSDELYRQLFNLKILSEDEKAPDSTLKREDAFVYMIRLSELEKVAKLSDIYKIEYADGHLIDSSKIGYSAILSGLGVICGDGGYLRPDEEITRAEAATMLYKFMLTF